MSPAGMTPGPEGGYLARARSLCVRGEAVGGCLVAWSASLLALGWDVDSMEDAVSFAASAGEESLSPDGQGILAWGPALLSAASLAQVARAGEVLVDGDVRALRAGQLSLRGVRASADVAQSVRGWRLDLEQPWKRPHPEDEVAPDEPESTDHLAAPPVHEESPAALLPDRTLEPPHETLTATIRKLAQGAESAGVVDSLAVLKHARARAEGGPPSVRCRASLALALTLSVAGRAEEALFEGLDALARAREAHDSKATGACIALLAKVYAGAGPGEAATPLRPHTA